MIDLLINIDLQSVIHDTNISVYIMLTTESMIHHINEIIVVLCRVWWFMILDLVEINKICAYRLGSNIICLFHIMMLITFVVVRHRMRIL